MKILDTLTLCKLDAESEKINLETVRKKLILEDCSFVFAHWPS